MSAWPRSRLPPSSNARMAEEYRETFLRGQRELYDSSSATPVGRLPVPEDLDHSTETQAWRTSRFLTDRFGWNSYFQKPEIASLGDATTNFSIELRCVPKAHVLLFEEIPEFGTTRWQAALPLHEIITAIYFPSTAPAFLRFTTDARGPNEFRGRSSPRVAWYHPAAPVAGFEDTERLLDDSLRFWATPPATAFIPEPPTRADLPRFRRQETFELDGEEYVRWVPIHPYIPPCGNWIDLELQGLSKKQRVFLEVAFPHAGAKKRWAPKEGIFFLDHQWDEPLVF